MWGPLISWLSKLDPNVVVPVVLTIGGWLWRRVAGEKAKTIEQVIAGAVSAIIAEIADKVPANVPIDIWLKGARDYVDKRIWIALAKIGVKRSPQMEKIVQGALEKATSEVAHRIAEERRKYLNGVAPP